MTTSCTRCLYDETLPNIHFDAHGVCNYCHMHDSLCRQYPTGDVGERNLRRTALEIREKGKVKPYDCIVGVSGGCDSSYLLYVVKETMGLRPLAVHFDNSWNMPVAVENMRRMVEQLDVPLEIHSVNPAEYEDICLSFLKAGVPDIEAPADMGLASALNRAAEKYGIQYVIDGHNFRTEGISPLGWLYMDGKYVESVQRAFGSTPIRTYPTASLPTQLRWMVLRRIKRIRPLWHMDYDKEEVKRFLAERFGWQWYGGHHLENRFTTFYHSYFMPTRYGIDTRLLGFAAAVRSGKRNREEALAELDKPFFMEENLLEQIKERLRLSDGEFAALLSLPKKMYHDYPTDKKNFERLRPFFWLMAKLRLIPLSFYLKYTKPDTSRMMYGRQNRESQT